VIRPLEDGEIDALAAELAALPLLGRYGRTPALLAGDLRSAAARGDGLLVHADGGPADGLAWFLPAGTFGLGGYLRLLAVSAAAQSRGAGAALLAAFEAAVADRSRHAFLLVSDFNRPAQAFYRRRGYAEVGRLPALVVPDIDELIYWKRLTGP
jgi:ribosomal protein S18 acetylase RimI-like enzyme